jgi:BirA family biotin operon repressor/biotin-[acetyl-CoA-carboxylase] ligase
LYKIPANTLFLGKNLVFVPECHSTNSLALEICQRATTPEGTLVITNKQTAGRGQRGNAWESQPGMNLTFSLVLKPTFLTVKDQFFLNRFAALAIRDYLIETYPARIQIKWPNDILANEFKICGILIENQLLGDRFTHIVLGIGLNINQQQFTSQVATSLSLITQHTYDLQIVLEGVLSKLETRYLQLRQNKLGDLKEDYLKHMYRLNEQHSFISLNEQFKGKILGVDEYGRLIVLVDGKEKVFGIKEISFAD